MSNSYSMRHKLNEAKYFLSQIQSIYRQYLGERTSELFYTLHYNLSAFYSAARSVTFYMQKQYVHNPGFSEWYESKRADMKKDAELKFLVQTRDLYIHERYPSTGVSESFYVAKYELSQDEYILTHIADLSPETLNTKLESVFFSDMCEVPDILILCNHQIEKLEIIVRECYEKFN